MKLLIAGVIIGFIWGYLIRQVVENMGDKKNEK